MARTNSLSWSGWKWTTCLVREIRLRETVGQVPQDKTNRNDRRVKWKEAYLSRMSPGSMALFGLSLLDSSVFSLSFLMPTSFLEVHSCFMATSWSQALCDNGWTYEEVYKKIGKKRVRRRPSTTNKNRTWNRTLYLLYGNYLEFLDAKVRGRNGGKGIKGIGWLLQLPSPNVHESEQDGVEYTVQ